MNARIKETLRAIAQGIKTSLCNWYNKQNEKWKYEQKLQLQERLCLQKQVQNSFIYETMCLIAEELLPVLQGRTYNNLCTLHSAADIRIKDYRYYNGSYIYRFELAKQTDTPYAFSVLESIRKKMQMDICRYQQRLISTHGHDSVNFLFPFVYNGLYIMKITDAGTDIHIYVASNYFPA